MWDICIQIKLLCQSRARDSVNCYIRLFVGWSIISSQNSFSAFTSSFYITALAWLTNFIAATARLHATWVAPYPALLYSWLTWKISFIQMKSLQESCVHGWTLFIKQYWQFWHFVSPCQIQCAGFGSFFTSTPRLVTDMDMLDSIGKLRTYRNNIVHDPMQSLIPDDKFEKEWSEIKELHTRYICKRSVEGNQLNCLPS